MPNNLTGLIPHAYAALNQVSRELIGFTPGTTRNSSFDRAAVGQDVRVPIPPAANVTNISEAMAIPEPTDQTIDNPVMQITKSRVAEFGYTGEETVQLNSGPGYMSVQSQQIYEGIRALTNEIETDLAAEAAVSSSRAYGQSGTTPFGANLSTTAIKDSAQVRKILDDNGAPMMDRCLALNTQAGANLRSINQLNRLDATGEMQNMSMFRQGVLGDLHGMSIRETGQAYSHTKGTATGKLVNGNRRKGDTSITVDGGSGTIVRGDVIQFAGHSDKYIVAQDLSNNVVTIAKPGLVEDVANNVAITLNNSYTANVAYSMSALILATRLPDLPEEGDIALDRFPMMDARSGLVVEISVYPGYRKNRYEVGISWGVKGIKPEHSALLLG